MKHLLSLLLVAVLCGDALGQWIITKGSTSQSVDLIITDTDGIPETSATFESSGIDLEYTQHGSAAVAITEVTQTAGGAYSSGGFVYTGIPGVFRLDIPNAALTGADRVTVGGTITGMIVYPTTIQLLTADLQEGIANEGDVTTWLENAIDNKLTDIAQGVWDYLLNTLGPITVNFTPTGESEVTPGTIEFEPAP